MLRREDGLDLRMALAFVVDGQWMKGRLEWTWKKQADEECMTLVCRKDAIC